MALSSKGKLFYADAAKGYTIKVMVDVLSGALPRTTFVLGREGISTRRQDDNGHILFDVVLPREKFREYKCRRPMNVSLNLKHLQKMVRNVKKKDSMVIFIDRDKKKSGKLGLSIRPEGGAAQRTSRNETVYIAIQKEEIVQRLDLPEIHVADDDEKIPVYGFPMVIGATDFQKIKKMTSVGKNIVVKMQGSNYISFYSDSEVFSSELEFGRIEDDPESESEDDFEDESEGNISDDEEVTCGSESEESENDESDAPESENDESDSEGSMITPKGWYEATFYTSMINLMVKLPGLCSQMQFFAPRFGYPLKIKMDAGTGNTTLGTIQVYIKDMDMIEVERTRRENQGENRRED